MSADRSHPFLRDVPLAPNTVICAVILNKKFPKHLVSLRTRTPVSPTFFRPSVLGSEPSHLAQPCPGPGRTRHAHDPALVLTGLTGPWPGSGGKREPSFLWDFLGAPPWAFPSPAPWRPAERAPGAVFASVSVTGTLGRPPAPGTASSPRPVSPQHRTSYQPELRLQHDCA